MYFGPGGAAIGSGAVDANKAHLTKLIINTYNIYVCMYVYIYIYTYMYIVNIYIYIHTYRYVQI